MNELVGPATLQGIRALVTPAADAAAVVAQHVNHLGWDASTTEGMSWTDWQDQLDNRFDPELWSWARDVDELLELGLRRDPASLLQDHHRWRERYDRLCGAFARAWDVQRIGNLTPAQKQDADAYVRVMALLWDESWWWLGWFGRWIHHRTR